MPKRLNSVSLSNNVVNVISAFCEREDISEAAFSRKFDKNNRWTSDLRRGRSMSLRTPEEAARMCVLLQTTPEEILVEEADIELVRSLIEQEREKGIKKERPADGEARVCDLPEPIQKIINICLDRPELASALLTLAQQIEKG